MRLCGTGNPGIRPREVCLRRTRENTACRREKGERKRERERSGELDGSREAGTDGVVQGGAAGVPFYNPRHHINGSPFTTCPPTTGSDKPSRRCLQRSSVGPLGLAGNCGDPAGGLARARRICPAIDKPDSKASEIFWSPPKAILPLAIIRDKQTIDNFTRKADPPSEQYWQRPLISSQSIQSHTHISRCPFSGASRATQMLLNSTASPQEKARRPGGRMST